MNVQNITPNSPSFGKIRLGYTERVSENLSNAILEAPAVKRLGRAYDAKVDVQSFLKSDAESTFGLVFYDITPKNIFKRLIRFLTNSNAKQQDFVQYDSGAMTEQGFINYLTKLDKDAYCGFFKNKF